MANSVVISNFPRYATQVGALNADQLDEFKRFAQAVAGALLAGCQVRVVVEGFADFDAKGRDFEQEVSLDRAINASESLRQEVQQAARNMQLSPDALDLLSLQAVGFGSQRPVVAQPRSEEERRQNRRVHLVWETTQAPPVRISFAQALQQAERALPEVSKPGPQRRLRCALSKLHDPLSIDGYFDFNALREFPGWAGWPQLTSEHFELLVKTTTRHARQDILIIARNAGNDTETAYLLETLDDKIGRSINDFQTQLVGDSATGLLLRTFNASIGRLQLDPRAILACYADYARIRHDF